MDRSNGAWMPIAALLTLWVAPAPGAAQPSATAAPAPATGPGHPSGASAPNVLDLVNRPQEAVFALQLLMVAFNQYFTTVADYNRAQFELFHALGYPGQELANLRPPGEVLPVDIARPPYLPPVGNGPPPATR
jgi:hypothetical protein